MEQILLLYLEGRVSENEFDKLLDFVKKNGTEWMEPELQKQWDSLSKEKRIPIFDKEALFDQIANSTVNKTTRPFYYKIAAAVTLVALASALLFLGLTKSYEAIEHVYAEKQSLRLPDGSLVSLEANSSIRFKDWSNEGPREVWLDGQAFFHVEKTPERLNPKFIVHTKDIDVQVLGTKFSVETSGTSTKVALKSGKVRLSNQAEVIDMVPGDLVVFESTSNMFSKQGIDAETYEPLFEKILTFENETLLSVTGRIKTTFGVNIVLLDKSLKEKRFSGEANIDEMESFYKVLEEVFGVLIIKRPQINVVEITLVK